MLFLNVGGDGRGRGHEGKGAVGGGGGGGGGRGVGCMGRRLKNVDPLKYGTTTMFSPEKRSKICYF